MEMAPPIKAAVPVRSRVEVCGFVAAIPIIRLAVDMRPSLAPNMPALSQLLRPLK